LRDVGVEFASKLEGQQPGHLAPLRNPVSWLSADGP
jgi:hypothetical protein